MSVDDISKAIIVLIRLGCSMRVVYCLIRMGAADEQQGQYKKRAKNAVVFYLIAELIWNIKDIIVFYYQ